MKYPTFEYVVNALSKSGVPFRELRGPGCVAVTLAAGRIAAMSFAPQGANLFWSNPELMTGASPDALADGLGGDRLWFSPELAYHWKGVPEWADSANYQVPRAVDPGRYSFLVTDPGVIALRADVRLVDRQTGEETDVEVERAVRMTPPPLAGDGGVPDSIDYVGIETSHVLRLSSGSITGRVDLWHLLQVPVGSVLLVPLKAAAPAEAKVPLSYALPGGWVLGHDHVLWRYGGASCAKFGLSAAVVTGRAAVLRELGPGYYCLIVRQFPVDERALYCDHPYAIARTDQVFQAWDGCGFGEIEYHSSMLDATNGARELRESDQLWAFGGPAHEIARMAVALLGIEIPWSRLGAAASRDVFQ